MKTFKQILEDTDEPDWASMPHEHLHAETHALLQEHDFQHDESPREKNGIVTHTYYGGGDPDSGLYNDDDDEDEHHEPEHEFDHRNAQLVENGLARHGWKRDHMGDVQHETNDAYHITTSYIHPNGSRFHMHMTRDLNMDTMRFRAAVMTKK